jgi:hypothetical protein
MPGMSLLITLASHRDGKPQVLHVEMTGEELKSALTGGGTLVRLPTGENQHVYVNPAHVVMARESSEPSFTVAG